jgi:ribosomal protein L7/L12
VSATPINKSNVTNTNTLEEEGFEPLDEEIVTEEGYDPYYTKIAIDIIKNEKGLKDTKEAYETLKSSRKTQEGLSEQEAEQRKAKIRETVMNSLRRRNITFNEEELNKTTNEFC